MKSLIQFLDSMGADNDEIKAEHNLTQDYNMLATASKEVEQALSRLSALKE